MVAIAQRTAVHGGDGTEDIRDSLAWHRGQLLMVAMEQGTALDGEDGKGTAVDGEHGTENSRGS